MTIAAIVTQSPGQGPILIVFPFKIVPPVEAKREIRVLSFVKSFKISTVGRYDKLEWRRT
ncbi:MAG: hypothetical protein CVU71_09910 [Deltaproteobacteria bacterium HGW-Deltaproteobacteria-6]|nr:MAG: hypothetical protein CVU71_09910 [Deltaproteobacteria bacterium HGW-Deltaproteobacteria-6]